MIIQGDSAVVLKDFESNSIDLTVTSPPYDDLRSYNGNCTFDFKTIVQQLFRVTKQGGIVVWIVGDKTENGSESGTSFKQALYFKEIGFNLHDTMIYSKSGFRNPSSNRYHQTFEYMFVFSKGKPKTFNPIEDRKILQTRLDLHRTKRINDEKVKQPTKYYEKRKEFGMRYNIWQYSDGYNSVTKDLIAYKHPAIFPEKLVEDHILSWSREGDLVLDPFCGSGTTNKMALKNKRRSIGIEINPEYIQICKERIKQYHNL